MTHITSIPEAGDTILGRYLLIQRIGRGGFGVVYKACDLERGHQIVAMKMLAPEALSHESVQQRFVREVRLMMSFEHPNLPRVFDTGLYLQAGREVALPFMTMEYLEGQTLGERLSGGRKLELDEAVWVLGEVLSCLGAAHERGIIHRDLKPSNVFLCASEGAPVSVKVLDFGIARAVGGDWGQETLERLTKTGMVSGTPQYMAPEQITGKAEISPALDLYAVGCLAYRTLSGKAPFVGRTPMETTLKHLTAPIPMLPDSVAVGIGPVVARAMAKDAGVRYEGAEDFARALRAFAQEEDATEVMDLSAMLARLHEPEVETVIMEATFIHNAPPRAMPEKRGGSPVPMPLAQPPAERRVPMAAIVALVVIVLCLGAAFGALVVSAMGPGVQFEPSEEIHRPMDRGADNSEGAHAVAASSRP